MISNEAQLANASTYLIYLEPLVAEDFEQFNPRWYFAFDGLVVGT